MAFADVKACGSEETREEGLSVEENLTNCTRMAYMFLLGQRYKFA